jgi:hypothetical protein
MSDLVYYHIDAWQDTTTMNRRCGDDTLSRPLHRWKGLDDTHRNSQPLSFRLGDTAGVILGSGVAVHLLRKRWARTFAMRSSMAWGQGSSTGLVPPFTPVVYGGGDRRSGPRLSRERRAVTAVPLTGRYDAFIHRCAMLAALSVHAQSGWASPTATTPGPMPCR